VGIGRAAVCSVYSDERTLTHAKFE